ncbi:hypothetical protein GCM10019016_137490 [Streptomyces prasinosporus]|uniref:Uncharacterized protein n=1 Tax=Streptomyces prasinosporus TaxID=68256 RepID=A0ABP6UI39_9ACTN|nr:hypothetical protein GCM10010332_00430 [Streptomyces albogriseolus]
MRGRSPWPGEIGGDAAARPAESVDRHALGGAMQELRFDDGIRFTAVVSSDQTGLRRALGAHELLASVYASPG